MQNAKAYNRIRKLELICKSQFQRHHGFFWVSTVICWHKRRLGGGGTEYAFIFENGLTNNSHVSHQSFRKLLQIDWVCGLRKRKGDGSLSWICWDCEVIQKKTSWRPCPTCWPNVFPAGSISTYTLGDWGGCQQNQTLGWEVPTGSPG